MRTLIAATLDSRRYRDRRCESGRHTVSLIPRELLFIFVVVPHGRIDEVLRATPLGQLPRPRQIDFDDQLVSNSIRDGRAVRHERFP